MADRYTDGSREVGYFIRSLNLLTGSAGTMANVLYKTLMLHKDDPVSKAIADSLKHDDTAMFEVDNFEEAKALRQKMSENGLEFTATAAYKDKVYVIIPKSDLERASEIVNDFYDSRSSGVFTADYINSYADGKVKEIKGLSEEETTLFIFRCKDQNVPINVDGPSDGSYRIRFAERDLDKMDRIRIDVAASMNGPGKDLYEKHLKWKNNYEKAVMNTIISGKYPDGKTVQEGSAIVGADGKRVEVTKQYIKIFDSGTSKRFSRNADENELRRSAEEISRFVKGIEKPVFLNKKEYELQKNMETSEREAFFADKERTGFLLPREMYKESLVFNAKRERSPDGSKFHIGDVITDDKGNRVDFKGNEVTVTQGNDSVSYESNTDMAKAAIIEAVEGMHNPVYMDAALAKELEKAENKNDFIRQIEVTERQFVEGREKLSKEEIAMLAKAESMRHTVDIHLQHDGIELPKTEKMSYHDAAQVFGLTAAETEDFAAGMQQEVDASFDEDNISDVVDQVEIHFGKTDPHDTVIPVSKELMIDSIFEGQFQDIDLEPDYGNDFAQMEFDMDDF